MLGNPFGGGFRADLLDAGHVVHRVTHQCQVVDDARGWHTKLGGDAGHVQPLVAHRVDQRDLLVDQLRQVLVSGRDHDLMPRFSCDPRERADRVVGLDAGHHQHRPAEQADHLVDGLDLLHQRLGHRAAMGLVGGVPLVAKGGALGIEHADRVLGVHILQRPLKHGHHAVERTRRHSLGPAQVGQRMVGAVQVAGAVNQQHHTGNRGGR